MKKFDIFFQHLHENKESGNKNQLKVYSTSLNLTEDIVNSASFNFLIRFFTAAFVCLINISKHIATILYSSKNKIFALCTQISEQPG